MNTVDYENFEFGYDVPALPGMDGRTSKLRVW